MPVGFGDLEVRNQFYDHIQEIKTIVGSQTFQIVDFASKSSSEYSRQRGGRTPPVSPIGSRFKSSVRFDCGGADYTVNNPGGDQGDGPLDVYDATTGKGTWTLVALSDRTELLAEQLKFTLSNGTPADRSAMLFEDQTTIFNNGRNATATQVVIFGNADASDLTGRLGHDHLYGGAGDDILHGAGGQDYLEGNGDNDWLYGETDNDILLGQLGDDELYGGEGLDRLSGGLGDDRLEGGTGVDQYTYVTGQGQDRIIDIDKLGSVRFDGIVLTGGLYRDGEPANTYTSSDGHFTYVKAGTDLIINNALTIENFDFANGMLGIRLADSSDSPAGQQPNVTYDRTISRQPRRPVHQ